MTDSSLRIRMIFEAMDRFTRPMRQMAGSLDSMREGVKVTRQNLASLQQQVGQIDQWRALKSQLASTAQQLVQARQRSTQLGQAIAQTERPTRAQQREFQAARTETNRLELSYQTGQQSLAQLRQELDKVGISTRNLVSAEARLKQQINATNQTLDAQTDALATNQARKERMAQAHQQMSEIQSRAGAIGAAGAGALGAGVALSVPITQAVQASAGFHDALVDVRKVLPEVTAAQFDGLTNSLSAIANRVPIAREGVVQIAAEAARAGVPIDELAQFTEKAAQMAAAFDIEASEAGSIMSTWRAGLGLTTPQVAALGDQVNALTNRFGGTAPAVADMIARVGPLGDVSGVAGGQIAAMGQLMNSMGIQSEIGATGIKNMMLSLTRGQSATRLQSAAFAELGLSATDVAKRMQTDAQGAIISVLDALNALPKERQAGIMSQLFGSESIAAIAPMLSQLDRLKENFALVGDASQVAGSLQSEFQTAMSKTSNITQLARNNGEGLLAKFGRPLEGVLRSASEKFAVFATAMGQWADRHPKLTAAIAFTVAGLAGLLVLFGGLLLAVSAVMAPFALLPVAMAGAATAGGILAPVLAGLGGFFVSATGAAWGFATALLANPLSWFVLGAIAVAGAVYLIYRNWDGIVAWFGGLWGRVRTAFAQRWAAITNMFSTWPNFFRGLGMAMISAMASGILAAPGLVAAAIGRVITGAMSHGRGLLGMGERQPLPAGTRLIARSPALPTGHPLQRRARGGPFGKGPLLVGEHGPELEFANRSGFIATHGQLTQMASQSALILAAISATAGHSPEGLAQTSFQSGLGANSARSVYVPDRLASAPPASPTTYHLHINVNLAGTGAAKDSAQDIAQEIEKAVAEAITSIEAERLARARSSFGWDADGQV